MADRLVQGARVYVEGKLSQTEWTGSDGVKRHGLSAAILKVVAAWRHSIFWILSSSGGMVKVVRELRKTAHEGKTA